MARPVRFEISDGGEGTKPIVSISGDLDMANIPAVARHLEDRLGGEPATLVLDLTGVTFMDSSGLRLLIELDERSRQEAWSLSLIPSDHEPANTVLRMTGADEALPFDRRPRG